MSSITIEALKSAKQDWEHTVTLLQGINPHSFYVVISGIQNSGKSTLGNALIGDYHNRTFKVGDYRLTARNEEKLASDGITYVDTPGYGTTREKDTQNCRDAWRKANLILFLHSSLQGGADLKVEMDMLKELARTLPDLERRLLIVCTKISGMSRHDSTFVARSFVRKANELLNMDCNFQCVDTNWYQEAMAAGASGEELVKLSGINRVQKWIAGNRNLKSPVVSLFNSARDNYLSTLARCLEEFESELNETRNNSIKFRNDLNSVLTSRLNTIMEQWEECNAYVTEIKNLKKDIKQLNGSCAEEIEDYDNDY